jgi:hypothetical protein
MKMHSEKKGWGSVAQELGIKPGSDEFHSLKENTYKIDREKIKMIKEQKNEDKMIEKESNKEADKIKVDDKGKKPEESPKKQKK